MDGSQGKTGLGKKSDLAGNAQRDARSSGGVQSLDRIKICRSP